MGKIIHQADVMQLNILDDRFYTNDGENFYPSVTTVLEVMPEGFGLEVWKKDLGHNADIVLKRAGEEGTHVHDAIQDYLRGYEVRWIDDQGRGYNLSEWTSISRFMEFWEMIKAKAKVIAVEMKVLSVNLRLGGAIDLVVEIGDVRWIIDYKTSNYLHDSFDLQISAYANIWNEQYPDFPIHKCGILHLKAQTRGADKSGKCYQGKGWKLYELEKDYNEEFQFFQALRVVWDRVNPDYKPKNLKMADRFRIDTVPVPIIRNNEPETPVLGGALYALDIGKGKSASAEVSVIDGNIIDILQPKMSDYSIYDPELHFQSLAADVKASRIEGMSEKPRPNFTPLPGAEPVHIETSNEPIQPKQNIFERKLQQAYNERNIILSFPDFRDVNDGYYPAVKVNLLELIDMFKVAQYTPEESEIMQQRFLPSIPDRFKDEIRNIILSRTRPEKTDPDGMSDPFFDAQNGAPAGNTPDVISPGATEKPAPRKLNL